MIIGMARPKKDASERKSVVLRIPVTEDQQRLIVEAASLEGSEMATWARPVLLRAAQQRIDKDSGKSKKVH
jgi:uncharacterized protein (DUF1778 family)